MHTFTCESCHGEYSTTEHNLTDCHEHMCDTCYEEYNLYNTLTKEQKEKFVEMFVANELDILETYTQKDLQDTLGKDIPELLVNNVTDWREIEQYLKECAKEYNTVGQIERDFDDTYCEIYEAR